MPPVEERMPWAFVFTSVWSKVMVVKLGETLAGNGVRTGMTNFEVVSVMVYSRNAFGGVLRDMTGCGVDEDAVREATAVTGTETGGKQEDVRDI